MGQESDTKVFLLGKKAFVSTLVAIALNPIGIAIGYGVGKWLQAPKLSAPTEAVIEAQTEGVTLLRELVPIVKGVGSIPLSVRMSREDREKLDHGILSTALAQEILADSEEETRSLSSRKDLLQADMEETNKWTRGQVLIVSAIDLNLKEAPQTIANRDKNELLGIYSSSFKEVKSRLESLERLNNALRTIAGGDTPPKRTGEAIIRIGILNSGDSEGVVYPKAVLRSPVGEIDLTAKDGGQGVGTNGLRAEGDSNTGGYVVVPPRSFREVVLAMDRSTRGNAAEDWRKLVRGGRADNVSIDLQTSAGRLTVPGKLPY
jgi:hypothetical protein